MLKLIKDPSLLLCFILVSSICILTFLIITIFTGGQALSSLLFIDPQNTFMDFYNVIFIAHMDPYSNGGIYPPLTYAIFYLIGNYTLPYLPTPIYVNNYDIKDIQTAELSLALFLIVSFYVLYVGISHLYEGSKHSKEIIIVCLLLSPSILFAIERANTAILTMAFIMLFLVTYKSKNSKNKILSIIFLTLAVCTKVYAIIFILLPIIEKESKNYWCVLILSLLITNTIPFLVVGGDPILYISNLIGWSSSGGSGNIFPTGATLDQLYDIIVDNAAYLAFVTKIILLAIIAIITIFNKIKNCWEDIALISIIMILVGGSFAGYYQLFLIPAFILFLNEEKTFSKRNLVILACFIAMFIPLPNNYFDIGPFALTTWFSIASTLLLFLLILSDKVKMIINGDNDNTIQ